MFVTKCFKWSIMKFNFQRYCVNNHFFSSLPCINYKDGNTYHTHEFQHLPINVSHQDRSGSKFSNLPLKSIVKSRHLGMLEKVYELHQAKGLVQPTEVNFLRSKFIFAEEHIRLAMITVANRHPMLRMRVSVSEQGKQTWKEIRPFVPQLNVKTSADWMKFFADEMSRTFDTVHGPLWRITYLPNPKRFSESQPRMILGNLKDFPIKGSNEFPHESAIFLTFHHGLIDGYGGTLLLNEIICLIEDIYTEAIKGKMSVNVTHEVLKNVSNGLGWRASKNFPMDYTDGQFKTHRNHCDAWKEQITEVQCPPSMDNVLNVNYGFVDNIIGTICRFEAIKRFFVGMVSHHLKKKRNFYTMNIITPQSRSSNCHMQLICAPVVFDIQEAKAISIACKRNHVTFEKMIATALGISLYDTVQHFKDGPCLELPSSGSIRYSVAANLRNFSNISNNDNATYTFRVNNEVPLRHADDFWKTARDSHTFTKKEYLQQCRKYLFQCAVYDSLLKQDIDFLDTDVINPENAGRISDILFFLTNLGNVDKLFNRNEDLIQVHGLLASSSFQLYGPVFYCSSATIGERLIISVTTYTHVCEHRVMMYFANQCKETLLGASS